MKSAELLLHPVRLRIIGAFLGDRKLTTADLQAELPDVPPTSLYRHLGHLIDGFEAAIEIQDAEAIERHHEALRQFLDRFDSNSLDDSLGSFR